METKEDITKLDLYELFGIKFDATLQEIKTAYRKKALTCHPDKNPDNPNAAKQFHQLLKALEILTDEAAKSAYDKILKARQATQVRNQLLDAKRRKLKEDLESREKEAEFVRQQSYAVDAEVQLQREIERLRKEGSKQVEQEMAYLNLQLKKEMEKLRCDSCTSASVPRLKVEWQRPTDKNSDPYTEDSLTTMFEKYGKVVALAKSKKGRAVIEFGDFESAESAIHCEIGLPNAPIKISWLSKPSKPDCPSNEQFNKPNQRRDDDNEDYENQVLRKLRQTEETKRIMEQMKKEDGEAA